MMKKVLITGAGSYIGDSVANYLKQWPDEYSVVIKDTMNWKPEAPDFDGIDVVFHVAGIAHRRETKKNAHLYYEINRDLAIAVAKAAKAAGVGQMIIMSTMAVYGMTEGVIRRNTKPEPKTHYGRSKLEADRAIWKMRDGGFRVAVLRPPMIYGKGCKGNYQRLRKLALTVPFFPDVYNQRSLLYIGNLNAFVKEVIDECRHGLFFPQNAEYVNTSEMVRLVALSNGKRVRLTRVLNSAVSMLSKSPFKAVGKVFGTLRYEKVDCDTPYEFIDTISLTEDQIV